MSDSGNAHGFPAGWQDWIQRELDELVRSAKAGNIDVKIQSVIITPQLTQPHSASAMVAQVKAKLVSASGWTMEGPDREGVSFYKFLVKPRET